MMAPSPTLTTVARAIAARLTDWPADDPVSRSLRDIGAAPASCAAAAVDCGSALLEAELVDEAEMLFQALARAAPGLAAGAEGLARVAMRRRSWAEALSRWDRLLRRFRRHPDRPVWRSARATSLLQLGQGAEAEAALRALVRDDPDLSHAFGARLRMLVTTGRPDAALAELEASPFAASQSAMIVETRLNILIRSNRLDAARAEFSRLLGETEDPAILSRLFDVVPALYEGWRRTAAWLALRERVEALARSGDPVERAADAPLFEALPLRLHLALRDRAAFLAAMRTLRDEGRLGPRDRRLLAVADALAAPRGPNWSAPKIFGVGLSKTGTTTLASALTTLGYNTLDWRNPLTMELMGEDDLHLFDAFTDTPVCVRFEEYFHMFPNARFIYTVRPLPSWRESISRHWRRHRGLGDFDELKAAIVQPGRFHYGAALRDIEQSLYFQYADFAQAYRAHDRRVRRFFADKPDSRFLVFDLFAGDGWPQLCAFLGVPAPNEAFPWTNRDPSARPRPAGAAAAPGERRLAALGRQARALLGRLAARNR